MHVCERHMLHNWHWPWHVRTLPKKDYLRCWRPDALILHGCSELYGQMPKQSRLQCSANAHFPPPKFSGNTESEHTGMCVFLRIWSPCAVNYSPDVPIFLWIWNWQCNRVPLSMHRVPLSTTESQHIRLNFSQIAYTNKQINGCQPAAPICHKAPRWSVVSSLCNVWIFRTKFKNKSG